MASPVEESLPDGKVVANGEDKANVEVVGPKIEKIVDQKIQLAMRTVSYSGPMPPPEHLAQYDRIVPGAARMIMDEFQANSRHARTMELNGMSGMIRRDTRAQWMAFILVLVGFYLVWELATGGHEKSAIAVATMLLGGIVTAFLTGHTPLNKSQKEEEADGDDTADPNK